MRTSLTFVCGIVSWFGENLKLHYLIFSYPFA